MEEHAPEQRKPWGRLTLVSKDPTEDSDHIYLINEATTIGRNKRRCNVVINKLFISSVHCVVQLDGIDDTGKPIVKLHDNSRNGIWVNANRVGKEASIRLDNGFTVHFTKPGTTPAGVTPMAYKFEFLDFHRSETLSSVCKASEVQSATAVDVTVALDESLEAGQSITPADVPSPLEKKRKRMDDGPAVESVVSKELENKVGATDCQVKIAKRKLEAAEAQATFEDEKGQTTNAQVDKLLKENADLKIKLKTVAADNFQLKKDNDMEVKIKEATAKNLEAALQTIAKLQEEVVAKENALDLGNRQSLTKAFEANQKTSSQEVKAKLKEATKKYQQQVEAEHFEQRRDMSEKMAAFAIENEKLLSILDTKDSKLAECEAELAKLRCTMKEKITILSAREKSLAESEKQIADLEEKLAVSKNESARISGLLAAAEEKIAAAENDTRETDIVAVHANASNTFDTSEHHELQKSIVSLRGELERHRTWLVSREEEHKKSQAAAMSVAKAVPASIVAEGVAQGEGAEATSARLAAALDLFNQVQALGRQGTSLVSGTSSSGLGEVHLLSVAPAVSEHINTAVPTSPSYLTEDSQRQAEDNSKSSPEEQAVKTTKEPSKNDAEDCAKAECTGGSVNGVAEPKASPSELKREKKKATKQVASLSASIEADVASTIVSMASVDSSNMP